MKQEEHKISKPESEINRVCATTVALYLELSRFYNVTSGGLPYGVDVAMESTTESIKVLRRTGQLARLLKDGVSSDEFIKIYKQQQDKIRQTTHIITQRIIDAACIVFAHGIIEDCVYGYITVTAMASPELWECYVIKKTVEIEIFKNKSFQQIRNEKIQKILKSDVKRESLIDKLDRLHKIVPPKGTIQQQMGFRYDRERLIRFDKARQNIVHGNDWSSYTFDFNQEMDYWTALNFYLAALVCDNTGLKLSPQKLGKHLSKWSQKYKDFQ